MKENADAALAYFIESPNGLLFNGSDLLKL